MKKLDFLFCMAIFISPNAQAFLDKPSGISTFGGRDNDAGGNLFVNLFYSNSGRE